MADQQQKLYAKRDIAGSSELFDLFRQHVTAIRNGELYGIEAIAAELAWRDAEIERLKRELQEQKDLYEANHG